jgi:long-chain acyl-CoA synthetase
VTGPRTLNAIFFGAIDRFHQRPAALRYKHSGHWVSISTGELHDRVRAASAGFRELGIRPGDRIALLSENRPEWAITDYACLTTRCAGVAVYPTLPPRQIDYILRDSGAVAICLSTRAQLDKVREIRAGLPGLKHVIGFDPGLAAPDVLEFDALLAKGREAEDRYPAWREDALKATTDELATQGSHAHPREHCVERGDLARDSAPVRSG